jgi:hypothetical protein
MYSNWNLKMRIEEDAENGKQNGPGETSPAGAGSENSKTRAPEGTQNKNTDKIGTRLHLSLSVATRKSTGAPASASKLDGEQGGNAKFDNTRFDDLDVAVSMESARWRSHSRRKSAAGDPVADEPPPQANWPRSAFEATKGDPRQVAFLIALAAFSGEAFHRTQVVAAALQKRFDAHAPERKAESKPYQMNVGFSRSKLFEQFHVDLLPPDGELPERTALKNASDRARIVWHALSDMSPEIGEDVRSWLFETGGTSDPVSRAIAGETAGALAISNFASARAWFLEPWRTASEGEPLDAFDAAMAEIRAEAPQHSGLAGYIDEIKRRSNSDDIHALGALAAGAFAEADPDRGFELLRFLIEAPQWQAFALALRASLAWIARGKENPSLAGRIWIELDKLADKPQRSISREADAEASDLIRYRKARIVMIMLELASGTGEDANAAFRANTAPPEAAKALARLLNYVVFFPDKRVQAPPLRPEAREIVRELFRAGMEYPQIREIAWPLFRLALEQGTPDQSNLLKEFLQAWRLRPTAQRRQSESLTMPDQLEMEGP